MITNDAKGRVELLQALKPALEDATGLIFNIDKHGEIIKAYDYFGAEIVSQSVNLDNIPTMIVDLSYMLRKLDY